MARRQLQIAGTERKEFAEVNDAAEELREVSLEHAELGRKKTEKKHALIQAMKLHKLKVYKYTDENSEEIEVRIEEDPKLTLKKTGEAESEIGEGIPSPPPSEDKIMGGLIREAQQSQADANVEETGDGDVTVPETAAPQAKRSSKRKGKAK